MVEMNQTADTRAILSVPRVLQADAALLHADSAALYQPEISTFHWACEWFNCCTAPQIFTAWNVNAEY